MPRVPFLAAVLLATAGCSTPSAPSFPDSITFGSQMLTKATSWDRGGISGIVYVPAGEQLPSASVQVGVIVSTEHTTAASLHSWVQDQFNESGNLAVHQSGTADQSCKAAGDQTRTYMSLDVCKTGVARAACVEADEKLDPGTFTSCLNSPGCFEQLCDRRWSARGKLLDRLAADVLSTR
jgi:hypothetical protein